MCDFTHFLYFFYAKKAQKMCKNKNSNCFELKHGLDTPAVSKPCFQLKGINIWKNGGAKIQLQQLEKRIYGNGRAKNIRTSELSEKLKATDSWKMGYFNYENGTTIFIDWLLAKMCEKSTFFTHFLPIFAKAHFCFDGITMPHKRKAFFLILKGLKKRQLKV